MGITAFLTTALDFLGPTIAPIAAGVVEGAGLGAIEGAVTGQNPLTSALTGGLTGGLGTGFGEALGAVGVGGTAAALGGDVLGGIATSAIEGKPIGQGALGGLENFALSKALGGGQPSTTPTAPSAGGGASSAIAAAPAAGSSVVGVDPNAVTAGSSPSSAIGSTTGTTPSLEQSFDKTFAGGGGQAGTGANLPGEAGALTVASAGQSGGGSGVSAGDFGKGAASGASTDTAGLGSTSPAQTPTSTGASNVGSLDSLGGTLASQDANAIGLTANPLAPGHRGLFSSPMSTMALLGLGSNLLKGNKAPAFEPQLTAAAQNATSQGSMLESYMAGGTLPPGLQSSIDQATNAAEAAIKSRYASRGMSGSSAEEQDIAAAKMQAVNQGAQLAIQLYSQGVQESQIGEQIYAQLMAVHEQQDQAASNAIGNFAGALAYMGGGGNPFSQAA